MPPSADSRRVIVLGSAAGGGLPQWNCNCRNCRRVRAGDPALQARTQASIAVGAGSEWLLVNASPDLRAQIASTPALWPRDKRDSPVRAVLLTGGEIDQVAGLLTLRENQPFALLATAGVQSLLSANPIFDALQPEIVVRRSLALNEAIALGPISAELFAVPGKIPLYLEDGATPETAVESEHTVGVRIDAPGRTVLFVPGCAALTPALSARLQGADLLLFDGTSWSDDELVSQGLGAKTARRMGHLPIGGPGGALEAFAPLAIRRKVFIHINNSNPILDETSPERRAVEAAGWEVATDGMEILL